MRITFRRRAAWILLAVFLLVLFVSPICIANSAKHRCCGRRCPVCETTAILTQALHGLIWVAFALSAALLIALVRAGGADGLRRLTTGMLLVRVKIRLNN